jgi:rRNA maturation endonuclease Nob1
MKKEKNVKSVNKAKKDKKHSCLCPYCEEELVIASCPFCEACGSVLSYCVSCQMTVLDDKATKCPGCGAPLKKGRKK